MDPRNLLSPLAAGAIALSALGPACAGPEASAPVEVPHLRAEGPDRLFPAVSGAIAQVQFGDPAAAGGITRELGVHVFSVQKVPLRAASTA